MNSLSPRARGRMNYYRAASRRRRHSRGSPRQADSSRVSAVSALLNFPLLSVSPSLRPRLRNSNNHVSSYRQRAVNSSRSLCHRPPDMKYHTAVGISPPMYNFCAFFFPLDVGEVDGAEGGSWEESSRSLLPYRLPLIQRGISPLTLFSSCKLPQFLVLRVHARGRWIERPRQEQQRRQRDFV